MGSRIVLLSFILILFSSCDYYVINSYDHRIGYIAPVADSKDSAFRPCLKEVLLPSYFSTDPVGPSQGRDSLRSYFDQNYNNQGINNESGYITFQFIVNCKGEIGNYKILQTGIDYKEKQFHPSIVEKLQVLLNSQQEWDAFSRSDSTYDCYTYLTFKIQNGELVEILP